MRNEVALTIPCRIDNTRGLAFSNVAMKYLTISRLHLMLIASSIHKI